MLKRRFLSFSNTTKVFPKKLKNQKHLESEKKGVEKNGIKYFY